MEADEVGKFKRNFGEPKDNEEEVQLGMGLLNDVSKSMVTEIKQDTIYIDMDRLKPNAMNEYSISDIEEMGEAIKMAGGILQNILVKPADEDGYYTITTGERRWRGAKWLKEKGDYPKELSNRVPCTIMEPNEINLPLSSENKELFSILVTNKYREKTDGDRLMEMRRWKEIFAELRKNGVEYLNMKGGAGITEDTEEPTPEVQEEQGIRIKGERTRQLVANQMGVSTGTISRFEKVEKKASPTVLEGLLSNKMDLSTAEQFAKMPEEKQEHLMQEFDSKEKITTKDVQDYQINPQKIKCKKEDVVAEIRQILEEVEKFESDLIEMSEADYSKLIKNIHQIKKIINK